MAINENSSAENQKSLLTVDQRHIFERLLSIAQVRASTTEFMLPITVLNRWSVPLVIGPAGCGKTFVCHEVARRWGGKPCRRWEVGSWMTVTNRTSNTTTEQIQTYVQSNPKGCVVYLAGIDALAVPGAHNASYSLSVSTEVAQLLERVSERPPSLSLRDGTTILVNALFVVGGCFGSLWGDAGIAGMEAWKFADPDPLSKADAAGKWLLEDSGLPADILRRLAPEPLIINRIDREEADKLAVRLRDYLPPSLDGLGADEFSVALQSPHAWRAVAAVIERAWVAGHDQPFTAQTDTAVPVQMPLFSQPIEAKPADPRLPMRLGQKLGIPWNRSRLLPYARRLGLATSWDLEKLAIARGYCLPGEDVTGTTISEVDKYKVFSDKELTAALLSPCWEVNERVICRGALMLAAQLAVVEPGFLVYEARRARAETVVRHVAWIGNELFPQHRRWRDLLMALPGIPDSPAFAPGLMPDDAIRRVLSALRS